MAVTVPSWKRRTVGQLGGARACRAIHSGLVGVPAFLSPVLAIGIGLSAGAAASVPSASQLLTASITDATKAGWVHEVIHNVEPGHSTRMVNDIGSTSGRQVIDPNGGHATVVVIGEAAYIQGDRDALQNYFGLPSSVASRSSGKWLSIPSGSSAYYTVSSAVTLSSDFDQARLIGSLRLGTPRTVDGQMVEPIMGLLAYAPNNERIPATLYVTTGQLPVPVEFTASKDGISLKERWTKWGSTVSLSPPKNPLQLAHLLR